MKNKLFLPVALAAVLLLTAVLAVVHLTSREQIRPGQLAVVYREKQQTVVFAELPLQQVKGTISNAKGETFPIDAKGISVAAFLDELDISGYSKVTVVADDEYRAEVGADEIAADGVVYLIEEDGGVKMLVFTDKNSKRNVSNLVRVEVS